MLCRDGSYRKINMAFRYGNSYGFQFEPQLTLEELQVWNRELSGDYALMGDRFDPSEEAARNLREFARYEPHYRAQMREPAHRLPAQRGPDIAGRDQRSHTYQKSTIPGSVRRSVAPPAWMCTMSSVMT